MTLQAQQYAWNTQRNNLQFLHVTATYTILNDPVSMLVLGYFTLSDIDPMSSRMQIQGQEPMTMEQSYTGLVEAKREAER